MSAVGERPAATSRSYLVRLGSTAILLGALTLLLVLVVLPRRYVLGSGFRESGVNFPSTGAPFVPGEALSRPAPVFPVFTSVPATADGPAPGPAEALWAQAVPLAREGRDAAAAALFADYLARYPEDRDASREYAVLLIRSGRADAALPVLRRLLDEGSERDLHLLLARTLRELGRPGAAATEYRLIWEASADPEIALEWSRVWSWIGEGGRAIEVLEGARGAGPGSPVLTLELARLHHLAGAPREAAALLATLSPEGQRAPEVLSLRTEVDAALESAAIEPTVPTLLEQAGTARVRGETDQAARLFVEALEATPEDAGAWRAWADFLQYEREDYAGARDALLRVRDLSGPSRSLELRLARLDAWSGQPDAAEQRLTSLLADAPGATRREDGSDRIAVLTLLGDLRRWAGDRVGAAARYRAALTLAPADSAAAAGLAAVAATAREAVAAHEGPTASAGVSGLSDIADYRRLDLEGAAVLVKGDWVLRGEGGHRWLDGADLAGGPGSLQGGYGSLEVARWWRLGTIRGAVRAGGDGVTGDRVTLGAGLRLQLADGGVVQGSWDRGPAYMVLGTLQSALAGYVEDRVRLEASRRVGSVWTAAADLQLSRLRGDLPGVADPTRLWLAGRVTRALGGGVSGGAQLRGLSFSESVPVLGGRRLFWDPESGVSGGPYLEVEREVGAETRLRGLVFAGAARLDEPDLARPVWAPQIEVEAGLDHRTGGFRGRFDVFYLQGQFSDYRSWGFRIRVTPSAGTRTGGPR